MSEEFNTQHLKGTEAALAALAPAPALIDRDRLMFRAGQAALARSRWGWPAATGVLAAVAATLALVMVIRPPVVTEKVVIYVPAVPAEQALPPTPDKAGPSPRPDTIAFQQAGMEALPPVPPGYLKLQEQILHWGLDALSSAPLATQTEPPLTREQFLGESPRQSATSPWWDFGQLLHIGGQS